MSKAVDAFDRVASGYDEWYATGKGSQVFSAETELLKGLIPNSGLGLEIGAGTGVFAKALTDSRIIVCIDLSHEMLARASRKGLPCVLGSADAMPLKEGVFGFAYMVTVVEFLTKPVASLSEASRVTSPDAHVVVLFINRESGWGELYAKMAENGDPIFSHTRLYTLPEIEEIGKKAGLRLGDVYGTLTTCPTSTEAGEEITGPSVETGVVAVKLAKSS